MVRPRNRAERRRRNAEAKDLASSKYRQRIVSDKRGVVTEDWRQDVQDYVEGTRKRGPDYLPPFNELD